MTTRGTSNPERVTMPQLSPVAKLLRLYMQTGLRGRTRATFLLARRLRSLQAVPIAFRDRTPVFVDLRLEGSHEWLEGSPWTASPLEVDEQGVLARITRPGDVVFDIGANIGLHAALLSRLIGPAGRLYAFEPNPQLTHCLRQTLASTGNARLYPLALSDTDAETVLYIPSDHSLASLADWTSARSPEPTPRVGCVQTTLDTLVQKDGLPYPDIIKCDVEGAELRVFHGASRTLNRADAPIVLFEANLHNARGFDVSVSAAKTYLTSLAIPSFRFFEVGRAGSLGPALRADWEHVNLLAVPASKTERIADGADRAALSAADTGTAARPPRPAAPPGARQHEHVGGR